MPKWACSLIKGKNRDSNAFERPTLADKRCCESNREAHATVIYGRASKEETS